MEKVPRKWTELCGNATWETTGVHCFSISKQTSQTKDSISTAKVHYRRRGQAGGEFKDGNSALSAWKYGMKAKSPSVGTLQTEN